MERISYFDGVAAQWDDMRKGFFSEAVRQRALEAAGAEPGKTAADIGAGTGFITEGLLARGLEVVAVDQSEAMLAEMRRKFPGDERVQYRQGDGNCLPMGDGTMDYVFANMYLHHTEDPAQAIREMARVLKPGGRLVITDLDEHGFEFLRKEHHDRWMGFKREDVAAWFGQGGLLEVHVDCAGQNCCADSCDGKDSASISIFVAAGIKV